VQITYYLQQHTENFVTRISLVLMCLLCSLTIAQVKKTTVAVISLKGSSGVTQDEADLLSDRLRVELFNTGSVDVMEREQMQTVLKEQGFQKSGACTDEGCLVEIGQILGVQKLITGSIGKIGSIYLVNARVIDIKTAKITKSFSEDVKGSLENVVERLPKIAIALCDSQTQTVEKGSKPAQQEAQATQPEPALDCSGKVYVDRVEFPQSAIGFTLPPRDWASVYDKLVDGLKSSFSEELRTASSEQLASATCSAVVIRPRVISYSTRPTKFGEKEGTLRLALVVYGSLQAKDSLCSFTAEATGDNHWGDKIPFANAIEAVAAKIKNDMDKSDKIKAINKKTK